MRRPTAIENIAKQKKCALVNAALSVAALYSSSIDCPWACAGAPANREPQSAPYLIAQLVAQSILPPAPDAIGGGNPFQGLGRPDDTGPIRTGTYINSDSQGNGIYSTGSPSGSFNGSTNGASLGSPGQNEGQSSFSGSVSAGNSPPNSIESAKPADSAGQAESAGQAGWQAGFGTQPGSFGRPDSSTQPSGLGGDKLPAPGYNEPPATPGAQPATSIQSTNASSSIPASENPTAGPGAAAATAPANTNQPLHSGIVPNPTSTWPQNKSAGQSGESNPAGSRISPENGIEYGASNSALNSNAFRSAPQMMTAPLTRREALSPQAKLLASAITALNLGQYEESLATVNKILAQDPKNAQAYYVKAVLNVLMRNFASARTNYEAALRNTIDPALINRVHAGLNKLNH